MKTVSSTTGMMVRSPSSRTSGTSCTMYPHGNAFDFDTLLAEKLLAVSIMTMGAERPDDRAKGTLGQFRLISLGLPQFHQGRWSRHFLYPLPIFAPQSLAALRCSTDPLARQCVRGRTRTGEAVWRQLPTIRTLCESLAADLSAVAAGTHQAGHCVQKEMFALQAWWRLEEEMRSALSDGLSALGQNHRFRRQQSGAWRTTVLRGSIQAVVLSGLAHTSPLPHSHNRQLWAPDEGNGPFAGDLISFACSCVPGHGCDQDHRQQAHSI